MGCSVRFAARRAPLPCSPPPIPNPPPAAGVAAFVAVESLLTIGSLVWTVGARVAPAAARQAVDAAARLARGATVRAALT